MLWDGLSSGADMSADTPERKKALHRYNIVMLAERFGWTADYIDSLDLDLYQDIIAITKILDFKRKQRTS